MLNIKKIFKRDTTEEESAHWEEYCKKTWSEAKVLIGLPNYGSYEDMTGSSPFKSFISLALFIASNLESTKWEIMTVPRMVTHEARNALAKIAVDRGFTHLMMIDSDHVFEKDIVHTLLLYKKDIVGVRAYRRSAPHYPCIFVKDKTLKETEAMTFVDACDMGLMVADAVGFGAILINVEVLKKMTYPYFYFTNTGEDFNFCREARELGFKIHVDTDIEIGHVTSKIIRRVDYTRQEKSGEVGQFSKDMIELIQENKDNKKVNYEKVKQNLK
jgi:hypothetical protein